jgi:TonB-dependent starch-binding outer membrane protein SusC
MKRKPFIHLVKCCLCVFIAALLPVCQLLASGGTGFGAEIRVNGKVTDDNGQPVIGATIMVKGTGTGTVTDVDGSYSISVKDGSAILVFSFTGYANKEEVVGNRTTIDVVLEEGLNLDEVVVVGYGSQRKVDLTGAVGSVNSKDITNRAYTAPDQILAGRISGIQVSNRSGDPGSPIDVRIRGIGTTGANQPLWVIDGVPIVQTTNITVNTGSFTESSPLAGINPSDIENIDVLKDASAAAIYGARAANGVVIVTTKRGKEGKIRATYDGYIGSQTVPAARRMDMLGVADYIALQQELGRDFSAFAGRPNVDWQDAVFQKGNANNHNLTVTGGTQAINFSIGGGFHDQSGVELGQGFKRYSFKANSDIKVGKYFRFGESAIVSSTNRLIQSESGSFAAFNAALNAPYFAIYDDSDPLTYGFNPEKNETHGEGSTAFNAVWRADTRFNETRVQTYKALGSVYGEFEPIAGLKYRVQAGVDYNIANGTFFQNEVDFNGQGSPRRSLLAQERPIEQTTNITHTITFTKNFGRSALTLLVGEEETNFKFNKLRAQGSDLYFNNILLPAKANQVAAANEADHWALRGYLGRVNYSLDDKYLLTVNVRRDETSRFSKDNRAGVFPSASLGWRISKEGFLANSTTIDDWKLRASWGQNGNQFTGNNFSYLPSLSTTILYPIGTDQKPQLGPAPVIFANSSLKWETSTQLNFGTDITLWKGKVQLTADWFSKTTNDVLLSLPLDESAGYFLAADANLGEIKNTGFEVSAEYRNRVGDFNYSIGGNFTTLKNEVVSLGGIPGIFGGVFGASSHRTIEGESLGHFFGYQTDGIYQNQAEVDAALPDAFSGGASPGDIRFKDVNGDGKINADDRTIIGSPIPKAYYGINLGAGWKGLDFSLFLQGVAGIEIYNDSRRSFEGMSGGNNQSARVLDRWTPSNPSTEIPRATQSDPNSNNRYSDRWIEDGSFLRIKSLQIGYTFPAGKVADGTKSIFSSARVFIGAHNLHTFTKYLGFDPEVTRGWSFQKGELPLANGQDSAGSPQPMTLQFGWQIGF